MAKQPALSDEFDDVMDAARKHFRQAESLDMKNPKAAKHHKLASDYYDIAGQHFKVGNDLRGDLAREKAERHAEEAASWERQPPLS